MIVEIIDWGEEGKPKEESSKELEAWYAASGILDDPEGFYLGDNEYLVDERLFMLAAIKYGIVFNDITEWAEVRNETLNVFSANVYNRIQGFDSQKWFEK